MRKLPILILMIGMLFAQNPAVEVNALLGFEITINEPIFELDEMVGKVYTSSLINEGSGYFVDSNGTLIVTESILEYQERDIVEKELQEIISDVTTIKHVNEYGTEPDLVEKQTHFEFLNNKHDDLVGFVLEKVEVKLIGSEYFYLDEQLDENEIGDPYIVLKSEDNKEEPTIFLDDPTIKKGDVLYLYEQEERIPIIVVDDENDTIRTTYESNSTSVIENRRGNVVGLFEKSKITMAKELEEFFDENGIENGYIKQASLSKDLRSESGFEQFLKENNLDWKIIIFGLASIMLAVVMIKKLVS